MKAIELSELHRMFGDLNDPHKNLPDLLQKNIRAAKLRIRNHYCGSAIPLQIRTFAHI